MRNESKIKLGREDVYCQLHITEYIFEGMEATGMIHLFVDNGNLNANRVTPAQLMELATGAATVACKMDPDNFDALWDKFKASVSEARTPLMTKADWDKAFAKPVPAGMTEEEHLEQLLTHDAPEPYQRGLTPTMPEDTTADVSNAREDEYLAPKPITDVVFVGIDHRDAPKYTDAYVMSAKRGGIPMNEAELEELNNDPFRRDPLLQSFLH